MNRLELAAALERVDAVLRRRPEAGLGDDAPAAVSWQGGARMVATHPHGHQVTTDMPAELGGSGDQVTPGWLFRAGLASCAATSIVMVAACEGVTLAVLEVDAGSRSDARGLLGLPDASGDAVFPGPIGLQLRVRIGAQGVAAARLRALVERGLQRSPVPSVLPAAVPMALVVEIDGEDVSADPVASADSDADPDTDPDTDADTAPEADPASHRGAVSGTHDGRAG